MVSIARVTAREILDSRGNPTVETDVILDSGQLGRAAAPSGASTGSREALELRDKDARRYLGKGVLAAVDNINTTIAKALQGQSYVTQAALDDALLALDGTENKSALGANALLAVSLAYARACANAADKPLFETIATQKPFSMPVPMMNIINGGAHADNNLDIQEFMIVPAGAPSYREALRAGVEIFHRLKSILVSEKLNTAVGDEGGFAPNLSSNEMAMDVIMHAIGEAGYVAGKDIYLALDAASSEFYRDGAYHLKSEDAAFTAAEFTQLLASWVEKFPIVSIEDGMDESDWTGWQGLTQCLGNKIQLVGDDLFVTNTKILQEGIERDIANAILIKFNQIGTLTETIQAIKMAQKADYGVVISHRSGETEDVFIADLAVATGAGQIKTGSLSRTDRVAKYNQLLRIEAMLGTEAHYAGRHTFAALR